MKFIKLLSTAFIITSTLGLVTAQNIALKNKTVEIDQFDPTIQEGHVTILNNTNNNMTVNVTRYSNILAAGHETHFCWAGNCNNSQTDHNALKVAVIPAHGENSITDAFLCGFNSNGFPGTSSVKFRFYNTDNVSDSITAQFVFDAVTGIKELAVFGSNKATLLTPYPNPADGYTNVAYNVPANAKLATIQVYNAVGAVIYKATLDEKQNELKLFTGNFAEGIHFCTLTIDGKVIGSKRFIVDHK